MSKLNSEAIDSLCQRLIATADSNALWVSPLAVRAALGRPAAEIPRALGLGRRGWPPADVAFFPLHDKNHWSLLVLFRSKGFKHLYHYDSIPGMHAEHAVRVVKMLSSGGLLKSNKIHIRRVISFPSQKSDWECGWYLARAVQLVLRASKPRGLTPVVTGDMVNKTVRLPPQLKARSRSIV